MALLEEAQNNGEGRRTSNSDENAATGIKQDDVVQFSTTTVNDGWRVSFSTQRGLEASTGR